MLQKQQSYTQIQPNRRHLYKAPILALLLLVICTASASADPPPFTLFPQPVDNILNPGIRLFLLGPYGGLNHNMHRGYFTTTEDGIPCCTFDNGSGNGPVGGVKALIPISKNTFISPRILYESLGGTFISEVQALPFLGENNEVEILDFRNDLDVALHVITGEALYGIRLTESGIYIAAGPSFSGIVSANTTKTERIETPDGVTYLDGTVSKQVFDGKPEIVSSFLFGLRGGFGVAYPISRKVFLNPEVLYGFPLKNASTTDEWKIHTLQATFGILFSLD